MEKGLSGTYVMELKHGNKISNGNDYIVHHHSCKEYKDRASSVRLGIYKRETVGSPCCMAVYIAKRDHGVTADGCPDCCCVVCRYE